MAVSYPKLGSKVIAKVIETKDKCTIGMKVGDEFELSLHKCGEFCEYFLHNIFGELKTVQFGGTFPLFENPNVQVWECPNANTHLKVALQRGD